MWILVGDVADVAGPQAKIRGLDGNRGDITIAGPVGAVESDNAEGCREEGRQAAGVTRGRYNARRAHRVRTVGNNRRLPSGGATRAVGPAEAKGCQAPSG